MKWCERGDLNPHRCYPLDPKSSASANSATFAEKIIITIIYKKKYKISINESGKILFKKNNFR
jgi:hypothetical protein